MHCWLDPFSLHCLPQVWRILCDPRTCDWTSQETLFLCWLLPEAWSWAKVGPESHCVLLSPPPPRAAIHIPFPLTEVIRASLEVRRVKGQMQMRRGLCYSFRLSFAPAVPSSRGLLICLPAVAPYPFSPAQKLLLFLCNTSRGPGTVQGQTRATEAGGRSPSPRAPAGPAGWLGLSHLKDSSHPTERCAPPPKPNPHGPSQTFSE